MDDISKKIGTRIRERRKELGMSQSELGVKVGYNGEANRTTISKIELGESDMVASRVHKFAIALETTPEYLLFGEGDGEHTQACVIPVLGQVAAGQPIFAEENYIGREEIPKSMYRKGEHFGLKIHGESMSPRIADGDIVIVRKMPDVESGDIAIVIVDNESATCKKVVKGNGIVTLISLNPAYPPMVYDPKDVQIIGKVVESRSRW